MIGEQLSLFENDSSETRMKDIDSVDLQTLPDDPMRIKYGDTSKKVIQYKDLPRETYYIFKTNGINRYKTEQGSLFPYVQNKKTGKVLTCSSTQTDLYPKVNLGGRFIARMHRLVLLAFSILPKNFNVISGSDFWVANHKDGDITNYKLSNLNWKTQKQNCVAGKNSNDSKTVQKKINEFFS